MIELTKNMVSEFENRLDKSESRRKVSENIKKVGISSVALDPKIHSSENFATRSFEEKIKANSFLDLVIYLLNKNKDPENYISRSSIMFYERLEKASFVLNYIIENEHYEPESDNINRILDEPLAINNSYNFYKDLLNKWGCFKEKDWKDVYHTSNPSDLDEILSLKIRQSAALLKRISKDKKEFLNQAFNKSLNDIYALLAFSLGESTSEGIELNKALKYYTILNAPVQNKEIDTKLTYNSMIDSESFSFNINSNDFIELINKELKNHGIVFVLADISTFLGTSGCLLDDELIDINEPLATSCDLEKGKRIRYNAVKNKKILAIREINENGMYIATSNEKVYSIKSNWVLDHVHLLLSSDKPDLNKEIKIDMFDPLYRLMNS